MIGTVSIHNFTTNKNKRYFKQPRPWPARCHRAITMALQACSYHNDTKTLSEKGRSRAEMVN